ncbi:MAG: hypothetical protein GOMPHAMPRED_006940 [Gomphillus americanus]|uniref:Partial AB-hydrolase lipase domain-containing protein n=1 Tax=Gomphillus americanus TaxID=1940652 RepID=A0A8H3ERG2_9LECA|nr:MAG: hypothetical protein GOMPHAMPRED_006940 [Gomphillus americanus]
MTEQHKKKQVATQFAKQAARLSLFHPVRDATKEWQDTTAVEARFITESDPVIELANGDRLPAVPLTEAQRLNELRDAIEGRNSNDDGTASGGLRQEIQKAKAAAQQATFESEGPPRLLSSAGSKDEGSMTLQGSAPPSRTNPLFPPLPLYGPPSVLRRIQVYIFRFTSFWLSLGFLMVIVLGSAFTSIPMMFEHIAIRIAGKEPDARRPFYELEKARKKERLAAERDWAKLGTHSVNQGQIGDQENVDGFSSRFVPTEGGKDKLICDVSYYARRVGLDVEEHKVQTEDGFIIDLWHVYNPKEYTPRNDKERDFRDPNVFSKNTKQNSRSRTRQKGKKYPILMMHGLLQSAGAYCTNDDDSLAFFLAKSGFDVWLGNNRCGFEPRHKVLQPTDPRFWCWNIRQMGVLDLPALISRVLSETGFPKLGLVCHSQGTTQTFVALAKEQRPDLGSKISVFCALAPAVYAGPLIGKMYFKFMRVISPGMFRIFFGLHSFIPFMMDMHAILPARLYGAMGYRIFSFLFDWTDDRWDLGVRDRMFQFAPVYVSAESMRWWLGRECFAKHRCILSTEESAHAEDVEDEKEEEQIDNLMRDKPNTADGDDPEQESPDDDEREDRQSLAWYDDQAPPMALWIAGSDKLVDGRRLLRRFEKGREPFVNIVHSKIIPEYEHLDVLWAMDVIEKVGKELRQVIWDSAKELQEDCTVPWGCQRQ